MSVRPRRFASLPRLFIAFLLVGGAHAVPVVTGWPSAAEQVAPAAPAFRPHAAVAALASATRGIGAERQSGILAAEDSRLLTLVGSVQPGAPAYVQSPGGVDTLVLTAGGPGYGLADLERLHAAEVRPDGAVLLTMPVFVAPGARLTIDAPGTTLRLRSEASGFASLVAWKAELHLAGAHGAPLRLISWDPAAGAPDTDLVDGRAYVRDVSGDMQLRYVAASHLGFWAGRTSGVAWTGSRSAEATGLIENSSFRGNHYGAFASRGRGLRVSDSHFAGNAVDGLSLHRSTAEAAVEGSSASGNGRHGFSADQGSESIAYSRVTANDNTAYGIFFSGRPLSDGQSAGGASLRTYGRLAIDGGLLHGNGRAGLRVTDGHFVDVAGTRVAGNADGIVLVGTSSPTAVRDTVVTGAHRFGITVTDGAATVSGNRVTGSRTAIRVRDSEASVAGNTVAQASAHGISVVGASDGSTVTDNTVGGRGPSGLDLFRLDPGTSVDASGNDVRGWTQDRDNWEYWTSFLPSHPMLLLWVVMLGLPLVGVRRSRRHRIPLGSAPYQDELRRERPPPRRIDVGRRPLPGGQA
jgi:hypothetical protein